MIYHIMSAGIHRAMIPALSQCEKSSGAVFGAGVEVTAGGGDGSVAEGGLHQVNGGAAVEGMRGVGNAASSAGKPPDRCQARTAAWRNDAQHPAVLESRPVY